MPRRTERIHVVLENFRSLWLEFPDQRFGQLILNSLRDADGGLPSDEDIVNMLWNDEDDVWFGRIFYKINEAIRMRLEMEQMLRGDQ